MNNKTLIDPADNLLMNYIDMPDRFSYTDGQ